jgi:ABC-2 type transport system ATP-binding protein
MELAKITRVEKAIDAFTLGPIDLTIEPGTITCLVGNNGSGKSTVLKLMMHLVKADQGDIHIFNKPVDGEDESWKNSVSYQPQKVIGWDAFTVQTLKDFIAPLYPNWDNHLFNDITEALNIPLNKRFGKLSQGVQQKLNLALTLPRNTPLLLLDEPTASIDIPAKKRIIDFLAAWMDHGERAIIMTSHQSEDIMKLTDYLSVLKSGKMVGTFEKEALQESFMRYWMKDELPAETVPGEVSRENKIIVSNDPETAEKYFSNNNYSFTNSAKLNLDEIITILLE